MVPLASHLQPENMKIPARNEPSSGVSTAALPVSPVVKNLPGVADTSLGQVPRPRAFCCIDYKRKDIYEKTVRANWIELMGKGG